MTVKSVGHFQPGPVASGPAGVELPLEMLWVVAFMEVTIEIVSYHDVASVEEYGDALWLSLPLITLFPTRRHTAEQPL